jgi:hypothetical protein
MSTIAFPPFEGGYSYRSQDVYISLTLNFSVISAL